MMSHLRQNQTESDPLRHSLEALCHDQQYQHDATGSRAGHTDVKRKGIQFMQIVQWLQIRQRYHFG